MPLQETDLPREFEAKIRRELESGERIVWAARPAPRFFTSGTTAVLVFALVWLTFSVSFTVVERLHPPAHGGGGDPTAGGAWLLLNALFILVGVVMLAAPFFMYWKSRNTVYAITDRRAIIIEGGWSTLVRTFYPEQLRDLYRRERKNGLGDVIMRRVMSAGAGNSEGGPSFQFQEIGFMNIRDPRGVEQRLRKLAENSAGRG